MQQNVNCKEHAVLQANINVRQTHAMNANS